MRRRQLIARSSELVAELAEQHHELIVTTVHVADDVEGTAVLLLVVPQRLALDRGCVHFLDRAHYRDVSKALALKISQRAAQLRALIANDVRTEVAIGPGFIPLLTHSLGDVQHQRHWQAVIFPRQFDQRSSRFRLNVGGIDDRQPASRQPLARDEVQHLERVVGRGLIVLIVGHQGTTEVRGNYFGRQEVLASEAGLARSRRTDQHHQSQLRNFDVHHGSYAATAVGASSNTAICVGGPSSASTSPMAR
jgi:hypothetical protein